MVPVRLFYDFLIEEGLRESNPVGRGRYTPKNRFERVVPYSASTGVLLSGYLRHRAAISRARGPLFLSESRRDHSCRGQVVPPGPAGVIHLGCAVAYRISGRPVAGGELRQPGPARSAIRWPMGGRAGRKDRHGR
jgi:hypothetical protein